jgi:hypothetical protein
VTAGETLHVIVDAAVREIVAIIRTAGSLKPAVIDKVRRAVQKAVTDARALERSQRFGPFTEEDARPTDPVPPPDATGDTQPQWPRNRPRR